MLKRCWAGSGIGLVLLLMGCPGSLKCPDGSDTEDLDECFGTEPFPPCDEQILADVPGMIFQNDCGASGCHGGEDPGGELDLVSPGVFDRLVDRPAHHEECTDRLLISRGSPDDSFLMQKILGRQPSACGDPMPALGSLTGQQIACVRRWILESSLGIERDGGTEDASTPPPTDAGGGSDAGSTEDAAGMGDAGMAEEDAGMMMMADCSAIDMDPGKDLCVSEADRCEGVFQDGTNCDAFCALAGMTCSESYANIDGMCAGDMTMPSNCQDMMRMSDYCVCTR